MILIKNRLKKYSVVIKHITDIVQIILDDLEYPDYDIGIWFTTDVTIARYNTVYRHKKGPTDILSFPYYTQLRAGETIIPAHSDEKILGDIIISLDYVINNPRWQDVPEKERLPILLVHGICHLLGYDHETDKDFVIMHAKELELLKIINNKLRN